MFPVDFVHQKLESILPKRTHVEIPTGEDVEEVHMIDFSTTKSAHDERHGQRHENYERGDSDDEGGHHVQGCRAQ